MVAYCENAKGSKTLCSFKKATRSKSTAKAFRMSDFLEVKERRVRMVRRVRRVD